MPSPGRPRPEDGSARRRRTPEVMPPARQETPPEASQEVPSDQEPSEEAPLDRTRLGAANRAGLDVAGLQRPRRDNVPVIAQGGNPCPLTAPQSWSARTYRSETTTL